MRSATTVRAEITPAVYSLSRAPGSLGVSRDAGTGAAHPVCPYRLRTYRHPALTIGRILARTHDALAITAASGRSRQLAASAVA